MSNDGRPLFPDYPQHVKDMFDRMFPVPASDTLAHLRQQNARLRGALGKIARREVPSFIDDPHRNKLDRALDVISWMSDEADAALTEQPA